MDKRQGLYSQAMKRFQWFMTGGIFLTVLANFSKSGHTVDLPEVIRLPLILINTMLKPLIGVEWLIYFKSMGLKNSYEIDRVRNMVPPFFYSIVFYIIIGGFIYLFYKELRQRRLADAPATFAGKLKPFIWLLLLIPSIPALGMVSSSVQQGGHGDYLAVVTVRDEKTKEPIEGIGIGYEKDSPNIPFDSFMDTDENGKSMKGISGTDPQAIYIVENGRVPTLAFVWPKSHFPTLKIARLEPGVEPDNLKTVEGLSGQIVYSDRKTAREEFDSVKNKHEILVGFGLIFDLDANGEEFILNNSSGSNLTTCGTPLVNITDSQATADVWVSLNVRYAWRRFADQKFNKDIQQSHYGPQNTSHFTIKSQNGFEVVQRKSVKTDPGIAWKFRNYQAPKRGWAKNLSKVINRGRVVSFTLANIMDISNFQRSLTGRDTCLPKENLEDLRKIEINKEYERLKRNRPNNRAYDVSKESPLTFFIRHGEVYGKIENLRIWVGEDGDNFVAQVAIDRIVVQNGKLGHRFLVPSNPEKFTAKELFYL